MPDLIKSKFHLCANFKCELDAFFKKQSLKFPCPRNLHYGAIEPCRPKGWRWSCIQSTHHFPHGYCLDRDWSPKQDLGWAHLKKNTKAYYCFSNLIIVITMNTKNSIRSTFTSIWLCSQPLWPQYIHRVAIYYEARVDNDNIKHRTPETGVWFQENLIAYTFTHKIVLVHVV